MAVFSQELPNDSLTFSCINQNNQSEGFSVLQEEELERQKSHIVNKKHTKNHQDIAECLRRVAMAAPRSKKT